MADSSERWSGRAGELDRRLANVEADIDGSEVAGDGGGNRAVASTAEAPEPSVPLPTDADTLSESTDSAKAQPSAVQEAEEEMFDERETDTAFSSPQSDTDATSSGNERSPTSSTVDRDTGSPRLDDPFVKGRDAPHENGELEHQSTSSSTAVGGSVEVQLSAREPTEAPSPIIPAILDCNLPPPENGEVRLLAWFDEQRGNLISRLYSGSEETAGRLGIMEAPVLAGLTDPLINGHHPRYPTEIAERTEELTA